MSRPCATVGRYFSSYQSRAASAARRERPGAGAPARTSSRRRRVVRLWYDEKYLPTVAQGRDIVGDLLESCTDTDLFLLVHRHERGAWGSVCGEPECIADMLLAEQRRAALEERSTLDRVLGRTPKPKTKGEPALLLPLMDDGD